MEKRLRVLAIAAHSVARAAIREITSSDHTFCGIITLTEEGQTNKSGLHLFNEEATAKNIPLFAVKNINNEVSLIESLQPDIILVLGWSQLLKQEIISIPQYGTLGAHSSLLPISRGRSPLNWAIINDEEETGITMFYIEPGADTGNIVGQKKFPIDDSDNIKTLYAKSEIALGEMVGEFLNSDPFPEGKAQNDDLATYNPRRRPSDGLLDFSKTTRELFNQIRALTDPYPGAYFYLNKEKVFALSAQESTDKATPGSVIEHSESDIKVATKDSSIILSSLKSNNMPFPPESIDSDYLNSAKDYPEILEYYFLDGEQKTQYPTNLKVNEKANLSIRIINRFKHEVHAKFSLKINNDEISTETISIAQNQESVIPFTFSLTTLGTSKVEISSECIEAKDRSDYLMIHARA